MWHMLDLALCHCCTSRNLIYKKQCCYYDVFSCAHTVISQLLQYCDGIRNKGNNCVSKTHIQQTGGTVKAVFMPLLEGNISVTDCMPLSSI